MENLAELKQAALSAARKAKDIDELQAVRVLYLGRKEGKITEILRRLKDLPIEKKREVGPEINQVRQELQEAIEAREAELLANNGSGSGLDITRPGVKKRVGSLSPLTQVQNRIVDLFTSMNFAVVEGPEVESEYYNFDALNIPANHPAREMWDTFWLQGLFKSRGKMEKYLMRTHTSPVQVRFMETHQPPFQIIVPGRVFRYETTDATHEINFHQVEGLMIGRKVTLANLKAVIEEFFNNFFGQKLAFRFRPSYFPFTEPSIEVDIKIPGSGKWLEVMGAGMVHPKVLKAVKIDPNEWQGFAFGTGVERLAILKYKIPDIRMFYSGDLRFNRQF